MWYMRIDRLISFYNQFSNSKNMFNIIKLNLILISTFDFYKIFSYF